MHATRPRGGHKGRVSQAGLFIMQQVTRNPTRPCLRQVLTFYYTVQTFAVYSYVGAAMSNIFGYACLVFMATYKKGKMKVVEYAAGFLELINLKYNSLIMFKTSFTDYNTVKFQIICFISLTENKNTKIIVYKIVVLYFQEYFFH